MNTKGVPSDISFGTLFLAVQILLVFTAAHAFTALRLCEAFIHVFFAGAPSYYRGILADNPAVALNNLLIDVLRSIILHMDISFR